MILIRRHHILIHLKTFREKFDTLCLMARKLYAYVGGECKMESVDAVSMQEVTLGGHTCLQYLKEKMTDLLIAVKWYLQTKDKKEAGSCTVEESKREREILRTDSDTNSLLYYQLHFSCVVLGSLCE